jgi:hypothetical protein
MTGPACTAHRHSIHILFWLQINASVEVHVASSEGSPTSSVDKDGFPLVSRVTRQLHGLTIHPPNSTHRRHKPSAGCSTHCFVLCARNRRDPPAPRKDLPCRSVTCIASSSAFVLRRRCARVEVAEGDVGSFSALGHGTARHEQTWKAERRSWIR